jgi:signal transduction histidine kinase
MTSLSLLLRGCACSALAFPGRNFRNVSLEDAVLVVLAHVLSNTERTPIHPSFLAVLAPPLALLVRSRDVNEVFRIERSPVDLTAILRLAAENCRTSMNAKQQDFTAELSPDPLIVQGDAHRLLQIFSNLLDNASKFTRHKGHITLSMAMHDGSVTIAVRDDGEGLTATQLPHVFDLFRQGIQPDAADSRGLGIGLSVVRELAEAHGGSVVAGSRGPGLGSEFVVTLPLEAVDEVPDGRVVQDARKE